MGIRLKWIMPLYLFSTIHAIGQDIPDWWDIPILQIETKEYQLFMTSHYLARAYQSNTEVQEDEMRISLHVTPTRYLFQLVKKSKGDTISSWPFISTGPPGRPLWIFKNGTICFSSYGRIGFRTVRGTYHYMSMTESIAQPKNLKAIEANETGLFMVKKDEPHQVYHLKWKAVKQGKWKIKKLVSSAEGMSRDYRGYLLREDYFFTERYGYVTWYHLATGQKRAFDFKAYFETKGYKDLTLMHFHHHELVFQYDYGVFAFDIKTKKLRRLNTPGSPKDKTFYPDQHKDYLQPDSLHVVFYKKPGGVLMQSKAGRVYHFDWQDKTQQSVDFSTARLVSDHDGISREAIGRYLRNITWQTHFICTAGTEKLVVYNLKTNQCTAYNLPGFNNSKAYQSTTTYKGFVHFNYYPLQKDLHEVEEITHLHHGQVLLKTSKGMTVFDMENQTFYIPGIMKVSQ